MPPKPPTGKKKFKDKFKEEGGVWKPIGEGWQSKPGGPFPKGPTGEIEPWADSLRIWMCEMNQWAQTVTDDLSGRGDSSPDGLAKLTGRLNHLDEQLVHVDDVLRRLSEDVAALKAAKGALPPQPS